MIAREFLTITRDLQGVDLVAIYGRRREMLEALQAAHGIARVYTDLDVLLQDPQVDTVYVALPNHLHHPYARAALLAGKHVICEKPFTMTLEQFDDLRSLAEGKGVVLVEAITTGYLSNYRSIRDHLPDIGNVKVVRCEYSQFSSRYPAFRRGEVPPVFDPALGGGALMDIGVYTVHFVVGLLGRPTRVRYTPNIERDVDTSGVLVMEYEGCQVVCVFAKDSSSDPRTVLQGDAGTIEMHGPPNACGGYTLVVRGDEPVSIDVSVHPHRLVEPFRAFERMIRDVDLVERDRQLDHGRIVLETMLSALCGSGAGRATHSGPAGQPSAV
jgi:predicted dehydrogenase